MIQIVKSSRKPNLPGLRGKRLIEYAKQRVDQGLAPPPEIYRIELRRCIDWSEFPSWARPIDPELFDRCCHEG